MSDSQSQSQSQPQARPPLPPPLPQSEGRSLSFYVALFLALLLMISGALNLILLAAGFIGGVATTGAAIDDDRGYQTVVVGGDVEADDTRILRVPIQGAISEQAALTLGSSGGTVSQVRRALKLAKNEASIKAVLFDINSPGGGVTDSDLIYDMIRKFKVDTNKPVMALFGDVSASGGYYIAAACDRIVARPTTITGSIGVIMSTYNFAEAMKKIGVSEVAFKSKHTPFKDILSPSRPVRPEEQQLMEDIVDEMYQRFVDIVDAGRPSLSREQVMKLADGRIYSAKQALDNGLLDMIRTAEQAEEELHLMIGGVTSAQVIEQRRLPGFMDILAGRTEMQVPNWQDTVSSFLQQSTGPKFLYFCPLYR